LIAPDLQLAIMRDKALAIKAAVRAAEMDRHYDTVLEQMRAEYRSRTSSND
jgi:hypothetical protein